MRPHPEEALSAVSKGKQTTYSVLGRAAENVEIGFLEMVFLHHARSLGQGALAGLVRGLSLRLVDRAAVGHLIGGVVANLHVLGARGLGGRGRGQDE
jgi:hypothetical protein